MNTRSTRRDTSGEAGVSDDDLHNPELHSQDGEGGTNDGAGNSVEPSATVSQLREFWDEQRAAIMSEMEIQRTACLADMEEQRSAILADMKQMFQELVLNKNHHTPSLEETNEVSSVENKLEKLKPGRYDGSSEWECYHRQFEMIAKHNRWNESSKASALAAALFGPALEVITDLDDSPSYKDLVAVLVSRFGTRHQAQRNLTLLYARVQQPKEDIRAFHQAIQGLARQAWPSAARVGAIEDVVVFHFMRGIRDATLRDKLLSAGPKTLDDALDSALRLEAVMQLSQPNVLARRASLPETHDEEDNYPVARLKDHAEQSGRRPVVPSRPWRPRCWRCESIGHLAASCPYPPVKPTHLALPPSGNERRSDQ
ncbi:hypothetical protein GE061_013466 [Apolygus lucorum]|uniref:CCHC-type domain-containing protein n=1 Tax=Apolygus lucorum TaxID=248454 RepID=A0A8S9XMS5_APOLU|nr:hypothetical protein GE061_013466 [Apolygus lucorum]